MKAIVTGFRGFVGTHLVKELEDNGYEVVGSDVDIKNYDAVHRFINHHKPDYIFHLAAIAYVPASWKDPDLVMRTNLLGTMNIFNAVQSLGLDPVIQIAGSSEEYGLVEKNELPITENNPLRPLSPYGVSKVAMDLLGYQYFKSSGLRVIRTRAFNHEGYGRGQSYAPSNFARQIALMEKTDLPPILKHGNLDAIRDITDVRDMVRAYRLAVEKCEPGEVYNIGSGNSYTIREVLHSILKGSEIEIELREDPKRMRPSDVPVLISDSSKFREATGWEPIYKLEETMAECLRYWRERV